MKFTTVKDVVRKVRRFGLMGRTIEFKINPIPENADPVGWVREAVSEAILHATTDLAPTDQVGFSFCSKGFSRGEGWIRFRDAAKVTTEDVWNVLTSIFQSNSMGLSTDTFCLQVTSVKVPVGKGRGAKYSTFGEECGRRKGIVTIANRDNLCLPRALVVAAAHATEDPSYRKVRRDIGKEQTTRALALVADAGVTIPEEGCGLPELHQFQSHLKEFGITVYQYGNKGRDVVFQGPQSDKTINLLYHEGHYNVITSLTSAFCCQFYCEECHVPYEHKNEHRCGGTCAACQQSPACRHVAKIKCPDCNRWFKSAECLENHIKPKSLGKGTVCSQIKSCTDCMKTVKKDRLHTCGEVYCKICRKHQPQDHLCYMQPDHKSPISKDMLFVFYDLETMQETPMDDGSYLHEANLCVFKTCCELCISSSDDHCLKCGVRVRHSGDVRDNIFNQSPVEWFMTNLLALRRRYKSVVVLAHNGQAFDHQFILNHILTKTDLTPDLIMRGSKIISMVIGNLKFIDSLNYFPMALSKLPKAFGLGDTFKKGYFPHLFNTRENQNYIGPLPAIEFYSPDSMRGTDTDENDDRKIFLKWHNEHKDDVFDFQKEILEYCISDVEILTQACLKFREQLLATSNVCPLTEACTIASACNKVFRRNYLKPETIGIIPKGGYRWRDNQSRIAIQWLIWEEKQRGVAIMHAAKGPEAIVAGCKVDGYCEETKQIFEFHGCYYHGHTCLKHNRNKPLHDNPLETLDMRYESTLNKTERLTGLGYEVIEMWECDFLRQLQTNPEIEKYTKDHTLLTNTSLNPRDAFYGGRTGNCKTYYEAKKGEKIKYIDVCSLYPWACKYGKYPVGHPQVIVGDECSELSLNETDGLIKCKILPPQNLYHPVLPAKMNDKLMFVLCRTCGDSMNTDECTHSENERALTGTWVIDEVLKAVQKGYKVLEIYEIWKYKIEQYNPKTKVGGLFTEMMNAFIKVKQQASGWPSGYVTNKQKDEYIEEFLNSEGIQLKFNDIVSNPGLRSLAKLMLNSFWGKLGQRENQPKTKIVNTPEEFFATITNPSIYVNSVLPINENVVVVNYEYKEEACDSLSTVNVTLAAYTTALARLKLYSYLEQLGDRVLYYDTDSVIYISREGEEDIPTGECIGDMTDELECYGPGSYITRFVSGGPKNYGYEFYSTKDKKLKTTVKVKGININYKTSKQVNFENMKEMILKELEPIEIVSNQIRRGEGAIVITKQNKKQYRPNSLKRQFKQHDSVPYGFKKTKMSS